MSLTSSHGCGCFSLYAFYAYSVCTQLKAYAHANGDVPSPEMIKENLGYAQKWNKEDVHVITQGEAIVIAASVLLAVYSIVLMIAIVPTVCNKLDDQTQSRKNYFYLYFWSSVPLIYVLVVCLYFYGLDQSQSATIIYGLNVFYINMVTVISSVVAVCFSLFYCMISDEKPKSIPFPLICFCECCLNDVYHCMNNCCAIFMTSGILVYLMFAFPAIVIAYYVFPSRTLVLLSFIQVALIVLVLSITLFLYLLERMCILCLRACSRQLKDPEAATQELLVNLVETEENENTSHRHHNQHDIKDKTVCCLICCSAFKAVVVLLGFMILFFLLVVLGMIVVTQSAEEINRFDQLLTILPTILINFIIWSFRAKLFHLGKTLTEIVNPPIKKTA